MRKLPWFVAAAALVALAVVVVINVVTSNTGRAEQLAGSIQQDAGALTQDPVRQGALSTVANLPTPPQGQITVQLRIRYQGQRLPGAGIQFFRTVPATDGLFTMKSFRSGGTVPRGDLINDGIVFVTPGSRLKTELVFENPSAKDVVFASSPWYVDPLPQHFNIINQCFCAGVPWFAPAGGGWYRTIFIDFGSQIPAGTKMAIVWTVTADAKQIPLLPGETLDSAIKRFNVT